MDDNILANIFSEIGKLKDIIGGVKQETGEMKGAFRGWLDSSVEYRKGIQRQLSTLNEGYNKIFDEIKIINARCIAEIAERSQVKTYIKNQEQQKKVMSNRGFAIFLTLLSVVSSVTCTWIYNEIKNQRSEHVRQGYSITEGNRNNSRQ